MSPPDLPSGTHPVCPRCGTVAGGGTWCAGCGLNLKQQGDLPTADAYTAKVREERWLEEQERLARERPAEETEQDRRTEVSQPEEAKERNGLAKERRPTRRRWIIGAAVIFLMLAGVGAAAGLIVFDDEEPTESVAQGTDASSTSDSDGATPSAASEDNDSAQSDAVVTETCPPVEDVGTTGADPADAVIIEARGASCSDATQLASDYFTEELESGAEPGDTVEINGYDCTHTAGSGGSTIECFGEDSSRVSWRLGNAEVTPQGFEYCPVYAAREFGVFFAGAKNLPCSEVESFIAKVTPATDVFPTGWECTAEGQSDGGSLTVCTRPSTGAEVRYGTTPQQ